VSIFSENSFQISPGFDPDCRCSCLNFLTKVSRNIDYRCFSTIPLVVITWPFFWLCVFGAFFPSCMCLPEPVGCSQLMLEKVLWCIGDQKLQITFFFPSRCWVTQPFQQRVSRPQVSRCSTWMPLINRRPRGLRGRWNERDPESYCFFSAKVSWMPTAGWDHGGNLGRQPGSPTGTLGAAFVSLGISCFMRFPCAFCFNTVQQ